MGIKITIMPITRLLQSLPLPLRDPSVGAKGLCSALGAMDKATFKKTVAPL